MRPSAHRTVFATPAQPTEETAGAFGVSTVGLHLKPGTREVLLERLPQTHPDSVEPLTALYDGRAHLPRADQQDLAVRVRRLVAQHRGRSTPSTRSRFVEGPEAQGLGPGKAATAAPSPGMQLPLFWGTEARCRRV